MDTFREEAKHQELERLKRQQEAKGTTVIGLATPDMQAGAGQGAGGRLRREVAEAVKGKNYELGRLCETQDCSFPMLVFLAMFFVDKIDR